MEYTEEVKKAIKEIKYKLDNDDNSWFYQNEIETIIDLLEKQQKEIERYKRIEEMIDDKIVEAENCEEENITEEYLKGYISGLEMAKTNNIEQFNKGKRIKFEEDLEVRQYLYHKDENYVYSEVV